VKFRIPSSTSIVRGPGTSATVTSALGERSISRSPSSARTPGPGASRTGSPIASSRTAATRTGAIRPGASAT
jgi:hypothetical protein